MKWQAELDVAMAAAAAVATKLSSASAELRSPVSVSGRDLKSQADREAQSVIGNFLSQTGLPVISEESVLPDSLPQTGPVWLVDPLDGTMNYRRGIPLCCVSIGLWEGNQPILGVIHDFQREEVFTGILNKGAWLEDQPITPSNAERSEDAVLTTGFPLEFEFGAESMQQTITSFLAFKKVRMFGSAALSLAYVACGRVDAYWESGILLWDVAAGLAIAAAAGAFCQVATSGRSTWAREVRCSSAESIWNEAKSRVL